MCVATLDFTDSTRPFLWVDRADKYRSGPVADPGAINWPPQESEAATLAAPLDRAEFGDRPQNLLLFFGGTQTLGGHLPSYRVRVWVTQATPLHAFCAQLELRALIWSVLRKIAKLYRWKIYHAFNRFRHV